MMKKTLLLLLLALLAAPLWGQTYGEASTEQLRQLANNGDATAQVMLGMRYAQGDLAPQDHKQAVYWWTQAANQGVAFAQYSLGVCYYFGNGVARDYKQAVYWWTQAANQGYANAQFYLGVCYHLGQGVPQDYKQAVYWYTRAANQGVAEAQYNLGDCYKNGKGAPRDYKQAVYWYTQAANQGYADAQYNLGDCYFLGDGVEEDCGAARYWFEQAAKQRDQLSYIGKNLLPDRLTFTSDCTAKKPADPKLPTTTTKASTSTPTKTTTTTKTSTTTPKKNTGLEFDENLRVVQRGDTPPAPALSAADLYNRGEAYFNGDGVEHNPEKAVELWTQSAEKGYSTAQLMLAECYKDGIGVKQDKQKAFHWYSKAAAKGNANAQGEVALAYFRGDGVQADPAKAEMWAKKAWAQRSKMHDVLKTDVERLIKVDLPARKKQQSVPNQQSPTPAQTNAGTSTSAKPRTISDDPATAADQYELATRYHHGTAGKKKDLKQAIFWYQRAANQTSPEAQLELGRIYYYGHGVEKDPAEALYWLQKIEYRQQQLQPTKPALVKEALEIIDRIKKRK